METPLLLGGRGVRRLRSCWGDRGSEIEGLIPRLGDRRQKGLWGRREAGSTVHGGNWEPSGGAEEEEGDLRGERWGSLGEGRERTDDTRSRL